MGKSRPDEKRDAEQQASPSGERRSVPAAGSYAWPKLLNAAATPAQTSEAVFEVVHSHIDCDLIELNLIDVSTGVFTLYRSDNSRDPASVEIAPRDALRPGEGLTGWLVENRKPLILADIRQGSHLRLRASETQSSRRSYLGVPIQDNNELIGTLEIAHPEVGRYDHKHAALMEALGNAVAIKLVNLHQKKKLRAARLQSQLQEKLLQQIKHISDIETLVLEVSSAINGQLDSEWVAFLIFNQESLSLETLEPIAGASGRLENVRFSLPSPPDSPLASLWKAHDYWIANEVQADEVMHRIRIPDAISAMGAARLMLAPLIADSARIGIILTGRSASAGPFTAEQGALLHAAGHTCGSLLQLALYRRPEPPHADATSPQPAARSTLSDSLLQITAELAASMDLDHLLTRVLSMLRNAVGADQGAFLLIAPDSNDLILRASSGSLPPLPPGGRSTPYRSDQGLAGWAIQNRMAICISDLQEDERWVPFGDAVPKQHSALVAPLIVSEQSLGAILLLGHTREAFSDEDLELVRAVANQIAPAIQNAQLSHLIQDQAERLGQALRTQQVESSQSRAVLHAITDGVIVTDPQHRIIVFNPAAELILGFSRNDLLGEPIFKILNEFGATGDEIGERLRGWASDASAAHSRNLLPRRVETERDRMLAVQPAPVVLGDDFLGTITIIRDITRDVELDRMKSEFVATVSHELRSPITPIKGFVDLLRMGIPGDLSEQQAHFLDIIYQNIHRLEMLVDELLDISRIEAGKVVLSFEALNIEQLIDELATYIAHRNQAEGKQISFHATLEADLPDLWGDPERVRQILTNLVDNSFDYTPDGGSIEIVVQDAGEQIEVAISDNGMGIAVKEQERIFERFYRGEQALIMGVAGAGLGLSIALTMVEMHGGRIWVNSAGIPGKGSTFTVSLPTASNTSKAGRQFTEK